jgi:predicted amidohydrolase
MHELDYTFTNLMSDPDAWRQGHPPLSQEPVFRVRVDGGPAERAALATVCEDSARFGYWEHPLTGLDPKRTYTVEVLCRAENAGSDRCRQAVLTRTEDGKFHQQLDAVGLRDGWDVLRRTVTGEEATSGLALRLYAGWTPGEVRWSEARIYDVTGAEAPKTYRVAVVSGNPINPSSPADCADFYCEKLDVAASARPDIVCLPELINTTGLGSGREQFAEPIPGPTTWRLAEKARDHGFYVAASVMEQVNDRTYNTGILIDRHGGFVGKYRKTHLPAGEGLGRGIAPGHEYPVFHTDFGSVAFMICYDGHFPEVARILALKGAGLILFPNMGDNREAGSVWDSVVRTRAVDNQVTVAASLNNGRSRIVSSKGVFLAETEEKGSVIWADCDPADSICDFSGLPLQKRYDLLRRYDTFGPLVERTANNLEL